MTQLETGISYVRRLVQGRLDIVNAEQRRRAQGGDHDLASLIDQLPEILAEKARDDSAGRLAPILSPGAVDPRLVEQMATAAPDAVVAHVTEINDDDLAHAAQQLLALEHEVSQQRRACHDALDRLKAEVVERYRSGEASVDSLLP